MKQSIYYLAAVLTVLTLAACGKDEKKEPLYEPPVEETETPIEKPSSIDPELDSEPPKPVTMTLWDKELSEVQDAVKGKWNWHSGEYINAFTGEIGESIFDHPIATYIFNEKSIILEYKDGYCENIYNFKWYERSYVICPCPPYSGIVVEDEAQAIRHAYVFLEIIKDTLFVEVRVDTERDEINYKLTKQH